MREHKGSDILTSGVIKILTLFIPIMILIGIAIYEIYSSDSTYNDIKKRTVISSDYDKANAYFIAHDYQNAIDILSEYEQNGDITPEMIVLIAQCKSEMAELEEKKIFAVIDQEDYASAKDMLDDTKYINSSKKDELINVVEEGLTNQYFDKFNRLSDIDEQISMIIDIKDLNLCGENKDKFEEMITNTISRYSSNIINKLSDFATYEEKLEYLQKSKEYFDTDEITKVLTEVKEEYAKGILSEVDDIYMSNGIDGVISYLENAIRVDESNGDIGREIKQWKEKQKNKVEINENNIKNNKLIMTSATKTGVIDPLFFDNGIQDAFGNNYLYGFAVVNESYRGSDPGEAEFLINGKYDYLRFTYAPRKEGSSGGNPSLKVFVDDELVLDVPEFKDPYIDPVTTRINVSGAARVKFAIPPGSFMTSGPNGGWLILEAELD